MERACPVGCTNRGRACKKSAVDPALRMQELPDKKEKSKKQAAPGKKSSCLSQFLDLIDQLGNKV